MTSRNLKKWELDQLEIIADQIVKYNNIRTNADALQKEIYDFYVLDKSKREEILNLVIDKVRYEQYKKAWENILKKLEDHAKKNGWKIADGNPMWFQVSNGKEKLEKGKKGNFKRYLTFSKDNNTFWENYMKLNELLDNIVIQNPKGSVSFKIPNRYSGAQEHKDNLVIHFNIIEDQPKIEAAVQSTGFKNTPNRKDFGRTDYGQDTESSDSDMIAKSSTAIIIRNLDMLMRYLGNSKNSLQYKQGLALINKILEDEMDKGTHRIGLKAVGLEETILLKNQIKKIIKEYIRQNQNKF